MAEWLNAAVSKTVYGYSPYEGSNPSSSAIMHRVNEPEWLVFLYVDHGSRPTGVVAPAGVLSGCAFRPVIQALSARGTLLLGGSCGRLKLCLMMGVASETTAFIGIHFSHANGED